MFDRFELVELITASSWAGGKCSGQLGTLSYSLHFYVDWIDFMIDNLF